MPLNWNEICADENTEKDATALDSRLAELFQTLNIPSEISSGSFDWGQISPTFFGSLFQSGMDEERRRGIGVHYTTEKNILKILKPLFLDALYEEFETVRPEPHKLQNFHKKLQTLTFLDPACGCGNFLILTYRELRLLEIEVLKALHPTGQLAHDVSELSRINVDAFYGIELEEFPARIAEVALWLMEHQMNLRLSETFGLYYARIPLQASANIHHANALQLDWETVVPKERLSYILGNPPFVGSKYQSKEQRAEVAKVFQGVSGAGILDYVTAWYLKAAQYIQNTRIRCAFVSTNSISQGEQVAVLWQELFNQYHLKIHFAHRTFAWSSEARGKAAVHCVIIGFAAFDSRQKLLYDYEDIKGDPHEIAATSISPYLTDGGEVVITRRNRPLCNVPEMGIGNKPIDGGNYLFTAAERDSFLKLEPQAAPYFRRWLGADEFVNGFERWCLWLGDCPPELLRQMPEAMKRVEAVRRFRAASKSLPTRAIVSKPTRFHVENIPLKNYLALSKVSTKRRNYIPFGFIPPETLCSDLMFIVQDATRYHFGVLSSMMHMEWMRYVCGRLGSSYRYSNTLVYNNFLWPQNPTPQQVQAIETMAEAVLEARAQFPNSTLADLYDPLTMPPVLSKAHQALDKAVDAAYRKQPFETERSRVEFLFGLYRQLTEADGAALPPNKGQGG
ncbi:MAG: class I SAM-dependent DNA methyltransferase [Chloroflexi bacterium]|nr:class I SAM-dependent DNA methyltransferase [Chloroflexota bacterium]